MEFYTSSSIKRPIRLSEETRKFAYESLNHKYGLDTRKTPYVTLDHIENFEEMAALEKHDAAIREIVTKAPIRICENERISGAATLGNAITSLIESLPVISIQSLSKPMPIPPWGGAPYLKAPVKKPNFS